MQARVTYSDAPDGASIRASTSCGSGSKSLGERKSTARATARCLHHCKPREWTKSGSAVGIRRLPDHALAPALGVGGELEQCVGLRLRVGIENPCRGPIRHRQQWPQPGVDAAGIAQIF